MCRAPLRGNGGNDSPCGADCKAVVARPEGAQRRVASDERRVCGAPCGRARKGEGRG
jgi:hypothetical protein